MKIAWKPQKKQEEALIRLEDEVLYGGSRGGGKTDAGMAWLLYDIDKPKYRALVIRRNADDLKDWVDRARSFYAPNSGEVVGIPAEIRFPSGALIRTGHLKDENAYSKYQGHEYQKMLIEELTHIDSEDNFEKLLGSCRSTVPGIKPQVFCTTNPDGPGFKWVKKRWCIPDQPTDIVVTNDGKRSRCFIPSRVEDNPALMAADPGYVDYLESIRDEDLRKAWREGAWTGTQVKGAYYAKQLQRAQQEGRITNVPYDESLKVHTWWDLGMGDSTTIGFFQVYGMQWRLIDYYEASGEGLSHYVRVLQEKGYLYGSHYAPHDIEVRELGTGVSRKESAEKLGLKFEKAPNLPLEDGIDAVRGKFGMLWIDEVKCKDFLERISAYRKEFNDKMGDWKSTPVHDYTSHAADMLRYWAVTNHVPDQLAQWEEQQREARSHYTRERNIQNQAE